MSARFSFVIWLTAGTIALLHASTASSVALAATDSQRTTYLLSRSLDGGLPNGPSYNGAVSHDQRIARYMAFDSHASDLVEGDVNGQRDVFLVPRARPWGHNGTFWHPGRIRLISRGLGGKPANGPSYAPALDGDSHHRPRCVAFISKASNLVRGDTNGKADAFVYHIPTNRIERVSVASNGRQANGNTYQVEVDGACERVAFISDATNLALRRTSRAAWKTAVTKAVRRPVKQAYVRILRAGKHDRPFKGLTFLASASNRGVPANRPVTRISLARDGKSLAFATAASNLVRGDRNGVSDIYQRRFPRKYQHPTQTLQLRTRLISQNRAGKPGNGPSSWPASSDQGQFIAYQTQATNLLPKDTNKVQDIVRADLGRGVRADDLGARRLRNVWVSKSRFVGRPGNGPSAKPSISGAGMFVLFESEATNLKPQASVRDDPNDVQDVFLWNENTGNVSLESRDSDNRYIFTPSGHPATSSRGNYVLFEARDLLLDLKLAARWWPQFIGNPQAAAAESVTDPRYQQVYLRYLGPQ